MNASRRVLRAYAPLAAASVAFIVMATTVSPAARKHEHLLSASGPITQGEVASGTQSSTVAGGGASGPTGKNGAAPGVVSSCDGRAKQVNGDPYSPPCFAFAGSNGGATSRGVTGTDITVAVRELDGPTAAALFAQLSGQPVITSKDAVVNTTLALAEYFSSRFQFYGRKLKIVFFKGQGNGSAEILGGGKEAALADAVQASQEIGAFADLSGITIPYADALSQKGVVNFGAPYPSRQWFLRHRPFAWSNFPDGTNVVHSAAAELIARQPNHSVADYAGGDLKGKPRKYAIVAPENQEYQESVQDYQGLISQGGLHADLNLKYKLDINSMPNQASNIIAQLKNAGITTVLCGCDPVMLALGLTPKANEQNYYPEWATSGLAFVDQDIVSQLIEPGQWSHAFGIAYNAESEPIGHSYPYAAYKQIRPNDEPAFGVEELYYQFYMLAIGIQMAGPNLTAQTFERGMFSYPGGTGPRGLWHFAPGDYTTTDDFREIWWDPDRISGQNNKQGAWAQLGGGKRYVSSTVPHGAANWFAEG